MSNANNQPNQPSKEWLSQALIQDIVNAHPKAAEILINEYGFHCIGCFASQFETLKEGAVVHGIEGADYEELLDYLTEKLSN